ncbi:hypothetical protein GF354_03230 [Candidatus Peregrinibacteria bacterium]|nr:hypothetical protein [Candidatus Peregrinibacteria bacterium]
MKADQMLRKLDTSIEQIDLSKTEINQETKELIKKLESAFITIPTVQTLYEQNGVDLFFDKSKLKSLSLCQELIFKALEELHQQLSKIEIDNGVFYKAYSEVDIEDLHEWSFMEEMESSLDYIKVYKYVEEQIKAISKNNSPQEDTNKLVELLNALVRAFQVGVVNQQYTSWKIFREMGMKVEEQPNLILDAFLKFKSFIRVFNFYKNSFN